MYLKPLVLYKDRLFLDLSRISYGGSDLKIALGIRPIRGQILFSSSSLDFS